MPEHKSIQKSLKEVASDAIRESGLRFFKENVKIHGVKADVVRKISRSFFSEMFGSVKNIDKSKVFTECEKLWKTGFLEESMIAAEWSEKCAKHFTPDDFAIFERWVNNYITNWASCDTFCTHTMGKFLMMYPNFVSEMYKWAKSTNRWVRRASAVSLILPAKNGKSHDAVFKIAKMLLCDSDDMVQKGYGWMLKVMSQSDQDAVFEFVMKHENVMPRTALRYAIEKMPKNLRELAMK